MATSDDLIAAVQADDASLVAALVAADSALANARDATGISGIMWSRYRGDRAVTDALLAVDPDLDVYEATSVGYADRLVDDLAADPSLATAFSADGFTALHFAAFFGKPEAARILIDAGAEVNVYSTNELHVHPLHSAAAGRHHEVCRVLLAAGADVNATQRHQYTRRRSTAAMSSWSCSSRPGRTRGPGSRMGRRRRTRPKRPVTRISPDASARSPRPADP